MDDIVEVGRRIYMNGFVAANDGNISVRVGDDEIITTPTGVSKGFLTPDMLVKVNMDGQRISGNLKPSSEIKMHIEVYKQRSDVRAVVHAHPITATGFAVAGIPLEKCVLPEVVLSLGSIPIAKYGTPSTMELPEAINEFLPTCDAVLLANHGALTVGVDVFSAYYKMETLEHFAKISLVARELGGERLLTYEDVDKLMEVRRKLNITGKNRGCMECSKSD